MKNLTLLLLFLFFGCFVANAQQDSMYPDKPSKKDIPEPLELPELPYQNGEVTYQEVFSFSGADQAALYGIALRYVSEYYKSAKSVLDVTDPATGLVVVKGNFSIVSDIYYRFFGTIKSETQKRTGHSLKIECRDERIRVTISNLRIINEAILDGTLNTSETPIENLIADYVRYEEYYQGQKPNKNDKYEQVNRSILIDELDLKSIQFLNGLEPYFLKVLAEEW